MIEATYGRFDDKRMRGYLAGPLSDRVGLVVAGAFRRTDGYFKKAIQTTPGEFDGRFLGLKQESVRTKLVFDATEALKITLAYNYTRVSDPRGVVFTPIENVSTNYTAPGRPTRPRNLGEVSGDVFQLDFNGNYIPIRSSRTAPGNRTSISPSTRSRGSTWWLAVTTTTSRPARTNFRTRCSSARPRALSSPIPIRR